MDCCLNVIFRSCSGVYAIHNRLVNQGRIGNGIEKKEIILRSLWSLVRAMNRVDGLRLTIVDDYSDVDTLVHMGEIGMRCKHPVKTISLDETGNEASLKKCYDMAKGCDERLVFFVEDDYLHDPDLFIEMLDAHERFAAKLGKEVALFPCDYIDNYNKPDISFFNEPARIYLGKTRHWRTVTTSTCTFLCTRKLVDDKLYGLWENAPTVEAVEKKQNRLWQDGTGVMLAPLPTLSVHLHSITISPFIEAQEWWKRNDWR